MTTLQSLLVLFVIYEFLKATYYGVLCLVVRFTDGSTERGRKVHNFVRWLAL